MNIINLSCLKYYKKIIHNSNKKQIKAFTLIETSILFLVIGILIIGVSTGLDLYQDYKITIAKNLTQNSRVTRIDDLVLWLETSQKSSFEPNAIANGQRISKWKNIAPNIFETERSLNNAIPQTQTPPKFIEGAINNLPALDFNKDENDYLWVRSGFDGDGKNNSIFLVLKTKSGWNDINQPRLLEKPANYNFNAMLSLRTNVLVHNSSLGVYGYFGLYTIQPNSLVLYEIIINRGDKFYFNIYGDYRLNGEKNEAFNGPYNPTGLSIGSSADAYFAELIIFDRALNFDERQGVKDYLFQKWGIKSKG
jgi:hypothetical protein